MKSKPLTIYLLLILIIGFATPSISFAANIGKAKMVLGKVMIVNAQGAKKRLRRGSKISVGDTIITSQRGQAQLTMIDGTKISVRPASSFKIDEFIATGKKEDQKTYYNLIKGGFRSVTGKIGKNNKTSFKLNTPVATMGIRGTDFTGKFCANDCPASAGKNGLFVDVISGGISMTNNGGTFNFNKDSNGYVSDSSQSPRVIPELPDNLLSPKAKKSKNGRKRNKNRYPSPEEETIQIGLFIAPNNKKEILSEAMEAGVPPAQIMRGADSAGLNAKDFVPDLIKKGKELGMEPSEFVAPILDSGMNGENIIGRMMRAYPNSASDILTAAFATGDMDNKRLKQSALNAGISSTDIESADTVGNLFALPPEVKKLLDTPKSEKSNNNPSEEKRNIRSRELNPGTDSGEVASPS